MINKTKPIIRWTISNVTKQGFSCLKKSIKSFVDCYGENFDFYICYNNIAKPEINLNIDVKFIKQESAILEGSGSIWKYTPARINISKKELFIDNDIVFIRKNNKILNFLNNDSFLICEDDVQYFGRFQHLFNKYEKFNAGLLGFPSGFDLEANIIKIWKEHGSLQNIDSADEQGLISLLIKSQLSFSVLNKEDILILHPDGVLKNNNSYSPMCNWLNHDIYHFVELNRNHHKYHNKICISLL